MKPLKSFMLLSIFLFASIANAQVIKLKATSIAFKHQINNYTWSEWSDFEDVSIVIIVDTDDQKITIFSKETQIYDVIEDEGKTYDSDGDEFQSYYCINEESIFCRLRFAKLNSQNGRNQLYIDFSDLKWVYNVHRIN